MKKIKNLKGNGFTLIELMVVIAIIAILAIVGITIFSGQQASARDARRVSDLDAVAKSMENHYVATIDPSSGKYICPGSGAEIDTPGYCPLDASWFAGDVIPTDPGGTKAVYCFWSSTSGTVFTAPAAQAQWGSCGTITANGVNGAEVAPGVGAPAAAGHVAVNSWMVCVQKESNPSGSNYSVVCHNSSQQ